MHRRASHNNSNRPEMLFVASISKLSLYSTTESRSTVLWSHSMYVQVWKVTGGPCPVSGAYYVLIFAYLVKRSVTRDATRSYQFSSVVRLVSPCHILSLFVGVDH